MKNKTRLLLVLASGLLLASTALSITSAVQCKTDYSELQDINSQHEQQLKDKDLIIDNLEDLIQDKDTALDNANSRIDELESMVGGLENNLYYKVNYYIDDALDSTEYVRFGEEMSSIPESTETYYLANWKLSDGTEVDLSNYQLKSDLNLYTNKSVRHKFNVQIQDLSSSISSLKTIDTIYLAENEVVPNMEFNSQYIDAYINAGWEFVGYMDYYTKDLMPGDNWTYYSNLSIHFLKLRYQKDIIATFKVDDEVYYTKDFTLDNKGTAIMTAVVGSSTVPGPTKEGLTFKGWAIEGAEDTIIDLATYTFQDSVTFVAVFE